MNTEQHRVTAEYLKQQGLSADFPVRFFSKVRITDSCWFWDGAKCKGYGNIGMSGDKRSKTIRAHRASYILHFGPIPEGKDILHDCPDGDCAMCVNPAHIRAGTPKDNSFDRERKGRGNHCKGAAHPKHKLSEAQVMGVLVMIKHMTQSQIARELCVSQQSIWYILHRKTWKHIKPHCGVV